MKAFSVIAPFALLSSAIADATTPSKFLYTINSSVPEIHEKPLGIRNDIHHVGEIVVDYAEHAFDVYLNADLNGTRLGVNYIEGIPTGLCGPSSLLFWSVERFGRVYIGNHHGTTGFSFDENKHVLFQGKSNFAVCLDTKMIYTQEPTSCKNVKWAQIIFVEE